MKIRFYILTCLLFGGLVSCNDWLDVKPETEMTLEEMYADQQGFQDALTGAYLELKNSSAYGTELMYGTIEYLAQHWDYTAESIQEKISQFNYIDDNVQNRFTLIYTQLYKIILSVNAILEQIDAKQDVFEPGMYEIIKGECLAMRAYCHFDLLRLFGPMPTRTTASKILPYVTKVGIEYNTHHSYQEFTELLENDLTDAGKLLYPFDPVIPAGEDREELNLSLSAENFLTARQIRFNYYAVKAMEARFYLWLGGDDNKAKAYDCATEVIEAQDSEGKTVFTLGSTDNIAKEDYSFSTEHILAIYDYNLKDNADNTFTIKAEGYKDLALPLVVNVIKKLTPPQAVSCQKTIFSDYYIVSFGYGSEIEQWQNQITGIKVNGTEYSLVTSSFSVGDTTTYCLLKNDGQIYVGTNAVADGENTIEISAEGYEDCTVTFTK